MRLGIILLAGGRGVRMGMPIPKTFLPLLGKPAILYSYDLLVPFGEIVVVSPKEYRGLMPHARFADPGVRRQDSVKNGLDLLDVDVVLVHDGARPLVKKQDVERLIQEGKNYPAAALASPLRNTLKRVGEGREVLGTPSREGLWEVHTPQMVRSDLLKYALEQALHEDVTVTDDLSLVEWLGYKPILVQTSFPNIKLTYPEDVSHVEALLKI